MINRPKVSVVVPVYNSEKYIHRCAKSLFEQTLDNIEFIFIDDCSTDDSIQILKKLLEVYPQRKSQVHIHKMNKNSGQALVRKQGIELASGEYLIHCDSDDWIDLDLYENLYNQAIIEQADIVVCNYVIWKTTKDKTTIRCYKSNNAESYFKSLMNQKESWALWNKLIHRNCYKNPNIIFPLGSMGEDAVLVLQYAFYANKVCHCILGHYYYFHNPDSITKALTEISIYHRFKQSILNADSLLQFFKQSGVYTDYLKQIDVILFNKKNLILPLINNKKYYTEWKNTFSWLNKRILFNSRIPLINRLKHLFRLLGLKLH